MSDPSSDRGATGLAPLAEGIAIAWDAMSANKIRSSVCRVHPLACANVLLTFGIADGRSSYSYCCLLCHSDAQ